ncbi:sialate O-acetylesterase [Pedobacter sp. MC2016-14]|uniref:sialate O-acetylesterase n=1 Tax=Pedobacter sp. MC2016-14 TaxID=2897327 RepID=UPI001E3C7E88|nr:sialate O-acetylesterase [Pedobacter sp. MC2016-14]MCD0487242.1 sialate O-acetylesterase [Pedobacter sp. MC2016-14]
MSNLNQYKYLFIPALLLVFLQAQAKVKLPAVISDYMVLQQKTDAAVWGKAAAGKKITITNTWNHKTYRTEADAQGNWKILMATPSYGGPYAMTISDGEPVIIMNILIGEVWVCSGQSNMEMPLAGWGKIKNYQQEIKDAKYPKIRLLQAVHVASNLPLEDAKLTTVGWRPCIPDFVGEFSAVAYFFAREVYQKTGVPIGLIHTSWGGTIAEAWTSKNTLKNIPDFAEAAAKIEAEATSIAKKSEAQQYIDWKEKLMQKDAGYRNGEPIWLSKSVDESSWMQLAQPGYWEDTVLPDFDGVVYLRKKITFPPSWAGKQVKLSLGTIDDNDITYFDGEKIGETEGYNVPRNYILSADKVTAGAHTIAIRVFDGGNGGGIYGEKKALALICDNGEQISLDGNWLYRVGLNLKEVGPPPPFMQSANRATVLYNAMINPFIPYAIRGAIWYQGESNADRAHQYRTLFPAMIKDWRSHWNQGDFPFYYVQLANYMKADAEPVASAWAELRDAQLQTLSLPNTGMAVTIDVGNPDDIHPKNKQEVGRRLALIALAKTYKKNILFSGPVLEAHQLEGNAIRLTFKFSEGGLSAKGGELKGFAIAGADQKFYWAKAVIKGNQILVSNAAVPNPVAVRYGWGNNPESNLYNGAGLPASPFKTDTWKDLTFDKK